RRPGRSVSAGQQSDRGARRRTARPGTGSGAGRSQRAAGTPRWALNAETAETAVSCFSAPCRREGRMHGRVKITPTVASQIQDDGFHEIQLNGKQLVFLFMAVTVVSVVIFLCGVLVGRGVRAERAATDVAVAGPVADTPVAPPSGQPPAPAPAPAG